jgi:16S rRNA (adenine1518-N6/adenine1519-N6)-dimethyltransferase
MTMCDVSQVSHLLLFLKSIGVHPKKSLSQNFLIDSNIVRKTAKLADIQPGDQVLEIGPGPGALTAELLKRGAYVTAIEKDSVFARELDRLQNGKLTIIEADILTLDWNCLGSGPWKVIGNLPYSITTPILETICTKSFVSFTFMAQKELADRLIAPPGSKLCGSISVFIQSHGQITGSFPVSRSCFYPSPSVDSTVLSIQFHQEREPLEFFTLVRTAFQQRRKMITSSLKKLFPQEEIKNALKEAGALATARPEALSLKEWKTLFKTLTALDLLRN